jgi:hypothetical protein
MNRIKGIFIIALLTAVSWNAHAQKYRVEAYVDYMCGCYGFQLNNVQVTIGGLTDNTSNVYVGACGGNHTKVFDREFSNIAFAPTITVKAQSICDDGCTPGGPGGSSCTPCIGDKTQTLSFSTSSSMACTSQNIQFTGLTCSSTYSSTVVVTVTWTPVYDPASNANIVQSGTDICEGNTVTLSTAGNYSGYVWQYKDASMSSFSNFAVSPGTGSSIAFGIEKIYGPSYQSKLGSGIQFQYGLGSCPKVTTTAPVNFFPKAPQVVGAPGTGYSVSNPACHNETGSASAILLNRGILAGESVNIKIFNQADNVIGGIPVAQQTGITSMASPIVFNNLNPGSYKFFVESNQYQCGDPGNPLVTSFTISNPTAVSFTNNTPVPPSCHTNTTGTKNNGSITIHPAGGTGTGYQYSADNGGSYQTSNVLSGLSTGPYIVLIKDSNGCEAEERTISVGEPDDIILTSSVVTSNYNGSQIRCAGESNAIITATASGGSGTLSYSNNGGTFTSSNVFSGLGPGSYTITVRDANSCSKVFDAVPVTAPAALSVSASSVAAICYNTPTGSISVTASSGGTGTRSFSIDGSAFTTDTAFPDIMPGSYTVTVRDLNLCTTTTSTTVGNGTQILPTATASVVTCAGGNDATVTISPNTAGTFTYSFNGGTFVTSNTVSTVSAGAYSIAVKDANGCIGTGNVTVTSNPIITGSITITNPISCNGGNNGELNLTPGGGVAPYTFSWSNGAPTEDLTGLSANTYSVTITDSKNCSQSFSRVLSQPAPITVTASLSDFNGYAVRCFGEANGAINITAAGGNGGYSYTWSNGSLAEDLSTLTAGTYTVSVTDSKACTGGNSFLIDQPDALIASVAASQNILCFGGNSGAITLAAAGGVADYSYSVNNGSSYQTSPVFNALTATSYNLRVRDANGCTDSEVITLTQPADLILSVNNITSTTCGQNNGAATASAAGGMTNYGFQWFNNSNALIASVPALSDVAAGIYRVVVTDQNVCTKQQTITISASDGPQVTVASVSPASCHDTADGSASISIAQGQAPYTILWPGGQSTSTLTGVLGGEYIVEVADQSGCQVFMPVLIPKPDPLTISILSKQDPNCNGNADGSIALQAIGGNGSYTYNWSNSATGSSLTGLPAGNYTVNVTDAKNCPASQVISLIDPPVFVLDLGEDRKICEGQNIMVAAGVDNATYSWTGPGGFVSAAAEVSITVAGTYSCTVITDKGCEDADSFELIYDTDLLRADFLMVSQAFVGDTVIVIDISWPLPNTLNWTFDDDAVVIDAGTDYSLVRFDAPGVYDMKLEAALATCASVKTQSITILENPEGAPSGRTNKQSLIRLFTVHPNPVQGLLRVEISLQEMRDAQLELYHLGQNRRMISTTLQQNTEHTPVLDLSTMPAGVYVLALKAGSELKTIRIIKL